MNQEEFEAYEKQLLDQVRKEMDTPETNEELKAYAINSQICRYLNNIQVPLLFLTAALYGGTLGKFTLAVYLLNKFGSYMDYRHKKRINKLVMAKMESFAKKMKEDGCNIEVINLNENE